MLDTLATIAICTGYMIDGEVHTEFPADLALLENAEPMYEWFDGWMQSTADCRSLEALPSNARRYLNRIEELCDTRITYVSVGTRRDQMIGMEAGVA